LGEEYGIRSPRKTDKINSEVKIKKKDPKGKGKKCRGKSRKRKSK